MSYNITTIDIVKIDAWMYVADIVRLHHHHEDNLPEICFIKDLYGEALDLLLKSTKVWETKIHLKELDWAGCWSGNSYEFLTKEVASKINGRLEAKVVWEDGAIDGLMIEDGKLIKCAVETKLVRK